MFKVLGNLSDMDWRWCRNLSFRRKI